MNIDTFLKIGHSHEICQDYILSGFDPFPYIIIADGCSGSADSDIGARILCHTALRFLKEHQSSMTTVTEDYVAQRIILDAAVTKAKFYTSFDSLDATLIIAVKVNGIYKIYMFGDGVVYWITPEDYDEYCQIYYKPNAPGYLRYRINDYQKYMDANVVQFVKTRNHEHVYTDSMRPHYFEIHEDDIKFLMVASDGVESFVYKEEVLYKAKYLALKNVMKKLHPNQIETLSDQVRALESLPLTKQVDFIDVCKDMLHFKNINGVFLKRRVKKVLKEYLKLGLINDDDLSIGCFHEEW
jgi:serine/threonine protein phosphatase PrpC